MAELNRQQHEQLGGAFSTEAYFGGFIQTLGGIYVPAKAEQVDGNHYQSVVNLVDSVDRRLRNAFPCYVYKDSTDTALQFSVKPFSQEIEGIAYTYAGAVNIGGLVAGSLRYIWADIQSPTITIGVGAAWPTTPCIKLASITPPASGHWLPQHYVNFVQTQAILPANIGLGGAMAIEFAFNTASPMKIFTMPANKRAWKVSIAIDTVFNGGTPTLSIGDAGNTSRLMGTADNDPKTLDVYEATPAYKYTSQTDVNLYITPSGATQGAGAVLLQRA